MTRVAGEDLPHAELQSDQPNPGPEQCGGYE